MAKRGKRRKIVDVSDDVIPINICLLIYILLKGRQVEWFNKQVH
jgi:hypothetical protein